MPIYPTISVLKPNLLIDPNNVREKCDEIIYHDVIKWKHFLRFCPFVRGIHRSPVVSLTKGQSRGPLVVPCCSLLSKHSIYWQFLVPHVNWSRVFFSNDLSNKWGPHFLPLSPPGWRGIVVTVRAGGRAGGCQTCGTHISVTAWWIFSVRSSMELSRPVVVHYHAHLPICPIWACPWAKNLSNLPQIGSRLCGSHISETAGWIYPI